VPQEQHRSERSLRRWAVDEGRRATAFSSQLCYHRCPLIGGGFLIASRVVGEVAVSTGGANSRAHEGLSKREREEAGRHSRESPGVGRIGTTTSGPPRKPLEAPKPIDVTTHWCTIWWPTIDACGRLRKHHRSHVSNHRSHNEGSIFF
jgi:hypothetical protein